MTRSVDLRLLANFARPGGGDIRWNLDDMDWSFGPQFSLAPDLQRQADRLLADGLITIGPQVEGHAYCDVSATDAGRALLDTPVPCEECPS